MTRDEYPDVPPTTAASILAYANSHVAPGLFVRAVLADRLFDAAGYADVVNGAALQSVARMVFNVVPGRARGSYGAVDSWIEEGKRK